MHANNPPAPKSRLWWWVVAAFALQGAVWTAWFFIAAKNQVQEVPLVGATDPAPAAGHKR